MIKVNPCLIVEVPWTFKQSKEEIALTQEEQDNFLSEMEDSWYKEMFYFMCLTGVRVGELGGMKWSDIDFKKKVVHVRRSLSCSYYNGEKRMMLVTPKTVNSIREIPFLGEMEEILKAQKKKQNKLKEELGSRWRSTDDLKDLVFTTGMGTGSFMPVSMVAIVISSFLAIYYMPAIYQFIFETLGVMKNNIEISFGFLMLFAVAQILVNIMISIILCMPIRKISAYVLIKE